MPVKTLKRGFIVIVCLGIFNSCSEQRITNMVEDGGLSFVVEVPIKNIILMSARDRNDTLINKVLDETVIRKRTSDKSFTEIFVSEFIGKNEGISSHFIFHNLKKNQQASDLLKLLNKELGLVMENVKGILLERLLKAGITNAEVTQLNKEGLLLVELPGATKNPRFYNLLQASGNLEFWETYDNNEIGPLFDNVNKQLALMLSKEDTLAVDTNKVIEEEHQRSLSDQLSQEQKETEEAQAKLKKENPLFSVLRPSFSYNEKGTPTSYSQGPVLGYALVSDTAMVNHYLNYPGLRHAFPAQAKFLWSYTPIGTPPATFQLIAVHSNYGHGVPLSGDIIIKASVEEAEENETPFIFIHMNKDAAWTWKRITAENIGHSIAIVMDRNVYSFPTVQGEISGGVSSITGNFTPEEAKDFVAILTTAQLPFKLKILQEKEVPPSGIH